MNTKELRDKFFDECVEQKKISLAPHDLFEWFKPFLKDLEKEERVEKLFKKVCVCKETPFGITLYSNIYGRRCNYCHGKYYHEKISNNI